jgi:hypothetical protein
MVTTILPRMFPAWYARCASAAWASGKLARICTRSLPCAYSSASGSCRQLSGGGDAQAVRRDGLILGHLDQLRGTAGVHRAKHQSFELYRRNLYEPEIITFDELLARAEWHVAVAEQEELSNPGG